MNPKTTIAGAGLLVSGLIAGSLIGGTASVAQEAFVNENGVLKATKTVEVVESYDINEVKSSYDGMDTQISEFMSYCERGYDELVAEKAEYERLLLEAGKLGIEPTEKGTTKK